MSSNVIITAAPQPGDFICVPIAGDAGTLIEIGQWLDGDKFQPYEHAEIYAGQPDENAPYGYTYSAYPNRQGKQALPCAPESYAGSLWSSGLIPLTAQQRTSIVAWCEARPAVPYSVYDYLAMAAHRFHLPLPGLKAYIADPKSLICSQYVDMAYQAAGIQLFNDHRWAGYVKPMDLAELLESKLPERLFPLG